MTDRMDFYKIDDKWHVDKRPLIVIVYITLKCLCVGQLVFLTI